MDIRKDVGNVPLRGRKARGTQRQYLKIKHTILCIQGTSVGDPQDYLKCGSRERSQALCDDFPLILYSLLFFFMLSMSIHEGYGGQKIIPAEGAA